MFQIATSAVPGAGRALRAISADIGEGALASSNGGLRTKCDMSSEFYPWVAVWMVWFPQPAHCSVIQDESTWSSTNVQFRDWFSRKQQVHGQSCWNLEMPISIYMVSLDYGQTMAVQHQCLPVHNARMVIPSHGREETPEELVDLLSCHRSDNWHCNNQLTSHSISIGLLLRIQLIFGSDTTIFVWTTNYFTSCDPHHDIYTFCYWQIFWHSIWHIFWQMFWHIFWHSIWHSIWHIFWHIIWHIFWHSIWQTFWHFIWHIFWHSIWHFIWHSIWHTFWHSIWHIFEHSIWHILWHFIWHIFWHSIWLLRSSGAHWARKAPGWGPAVRTELGRSQVEVQRCALS